MPHSTEPLTPARRLGRRSEEGREPGDLPPAQLGPSPREEDGGGFMTTKHLPTAGPRAVLASSRALQMTLAALLGLFLIGGTGFAQIDAVHNAAHDSRHSVAFPCH